MPEKSFTGIYQKTISYRPRNDYCVCVIKSDCITTLGKEFIECGGTMPRFSKGTPLIFHGNWDEKEEFFSIKKVQINYSNKDAVRMFIKDCFPKTLSDESATRIMEIAEKHSMKIGDLASSDNWKEYLSEFNFTEATLSRFKNNISQKCEVLDLMEELGPAGLSVKQASVLVDSYGGHVLENANINPYNVFCKNGVPFPIADHYAKKNGGIFLNHSRLSFIAREAFEKLLNTSCSYFTFKNYMAAFRIVESEGAFEEKVPQAMAAMAAQDAENGLIKDVNGEVRLYHKDTYFTENSIAAILKKNLREKKNFLNSKEIYNYIEKDKTLDREQKIAIKGMLCNTSISLLIGKPGTGKTYTLKKLVETINTFAPEKNIALCAPTGRAAERMSEATGCIATTIHVLLEYKSIYGEDAKPQKGEENPLEKDLIIVDETSMVGIFLFEQLLKAMKPGTKLILVGDWRQLPSIEPGDVLYDLEHCKMFDTFCLNTIHRQTGSGKSIVENSHAIMKRAEGTPYDQVFAEIKEDENFQIINFDNNQDAFSRCVDLYLKYGDNYDLDKIHIISPQRKGQYGTEKLNKIIQSAYISGKDERKRAVLKEVEVAKEIIDQNGNVQKEKEVRPEYIYIGDKVMTIMNNYEKEALYFNGDLWTVTFISQKELILMNGEKQLTFPRANMDDLSLAYALSVHKCQGSEGDIIILMLPDDVSPRLITGSLLYTAITRAKSKIFILNVNHTFEKYVASIFKRSKNSSLMEKLEEK